MPPPGGRLNIHLRLSPSARSSVFADHLSVRASAPPCHVPLFYVKATALTFTRGARSMSKVLQSMKIAFRALRVNKLRSILTMLGIIIGVGAVIAMVAVGNGATARIQEQIASIGSNVIIIQGGSQNVNGVKAGNGNAQ